MATVQPSERSGLVTFAGVMLMLAGALNVMQGIVALVADNHFDEGELLFGSLTAWGVWWLALGALLLFGGLRVIARSASGAIIGFTFAGISAFTQFLSLGAYPIWAIAVITISMLIIYALTTHVDEFE
jgi:hypothetical protein